MGDRYYLRLGDLPGTSTDERHPDGEVEDRFSLVFAQIEVRTTDGQQEITAGWDVARNVRL